MRVTPGLEKSWSFPARSRSLSTIIDRRHAELWALSDIPRIWKPALNRVWAFLRTHGDLEPGHNLFLYHHPAHRHEAMNIDFGVQVAHPFEPQEDVRCIRTPAGEVAKTLH